jgi:hypothetical protein
MRYERGITSDVSNFNQDQKEILKYALNRQWGVPVFKIDNFIGNSHFTPFGKIRQFMMELQVRENVVMDLELIIEELKAKIEIETEEIEATDSPGRKKLHAVQIAKHEKDLYAYREKVTYAYEDRDKIMMLISRFNDSEDGKLPDGRRLVDCLGDHDLEEQLEEEMWVERLGSQAAWDIAFYGRPGIGNVEAIQQMPKDVQIKTIQFAAKKAIETSHVFELATKQAMAELEFNDEEWLNLESKELE